MRLFLQITPHSWLLPRSGERHICTEERLTILRHDLLGLLFVAKPLVLYHAGRFKEKIHGTGLHSKSGSTQ